MVLKTSADALVWNLSRSLCVFALVFQPPDRREDKFLEHCVVPARDFLHISNSSTQVVQSSSATVLEDDYQGTPDMIDVSSFSAMVSHWSWHQLRNRLWGNVRIHIDGQPPTTTYWTRASSFKVGVYLTSIFTGSHR